MKQMSFASTGFERPRKRMRFMRERLPGRQCARKTPTGKKSTPKRVCKAVDTDTEGL